MKKSNLLPTKSQILKAKIDELQIELIAAMEVEQDLTSGSPMALANFLHETLCSYNHVDSCNWEYENWQNPGPCRTGWLDRSEAILSTCKAEAISTAVLIRVIQLVHK